MAPDSVDSRRTRQLALVAVCLLGLLVAAFAAPTISATGPGIGPPPGGGGGGGGSAGDGGGGAGISDLIRWLAGETDDSGEGDGDPPPLQRPETETPPEDACSIQFVDDPLPGERVTIVVTQGRDEIENARVSLNGEYVGTTNTYGHVETVVPYERRLALSAELPSDVTCSAVTRREARGAPAASSVEHLSLSTAQSAATARQEDGDGDNVSNSYSVDAEVNITVRGRPIPGDEVDLEARVDRVPMRKAIVRVDGERVGRTDTAGQFDLRLPADGRERITVRVSRGEFNGTKEIRLAQLSATLRPAMIFAIPGGETRVRATLGQEPVAGASVGYQGKTLGETNVRGVTTISLPSDPTGSVTVEAAGQQVSKAVWPLYAGTAILGALALVGVVLGLTLLVFGAAWLVRLLRWLAAAALQVATRLEDAVVWARDALGRFRRWLADLFATGRESVPALLSRFGSWLLDLPGLVLAAVIRVLGWAGAVLAWLWHAPGRLWRWLRGLGENDDAAVEGTSDEGTREQGPPVGVEQGPTNLRERWRAFARWVSPRDWRKRTPGEVARDAVATGFPDDAVETFTDAFRDVEYGNVPLSEERREQARAAFESLEAYRQGVRVPSDRQPGEMGESDHTRSTDGGRSLHAAPGIGSTADDTEERDDS